MKLKFIFLSLVISSSMLFSNQINNLNSKLRKNVVPVQTDSNIRTLEYSPNNQTLRIFVDYREPTKVVFPAFIEKVELIDKSGTVSINEEQLERGTDTLFLTFTEKPTSSLGIIYLYVTVNGKRIIIEVQQSSNFDKMVKVEMPFSSSSPQAQSKPVKRINSKDLTRRTNIRSAEMILKMLEGTRKEYYDEVELDGTFTPPKDSFFSFSSEPAQSVALNVFKKLFRDQVDFFSLYRNRIIQPVELYTDSYSVVKSNRVTESLNIFGMKTKWCNYSQTNAIQITIDDVKTVFGKNLLKVKHPLDKIAPKTCEYVYTIFYRR